MKRECANTTHKHTMPWYSSYKVVIIVWVPCIKFTEVEAKKSALKDRTEFLRKRFLSRQAHTLHHRREWAPLDDLCLWLPVGNPALISLFLPLIALIGITGRRRREILTCTQDKITRAKLERLCSARLIRHDPKATNSRHAKSSKVVQTQAY
jgi:hypothetical protein